MPANRLEHYEGDGEFTLFDGSTKGFERTHGKVDGRSAAASGALISNSDSDNVAVLEVSNLNLTAAESAASVQDSVERADDGRVRVDFAASAFNAVLREVGTYSTGNRAATTAASRSGRLR